MDRSGIGKMNSTLMWLWVLLTFGFIILMLAAANAKSYLLLTLGVSLLIPSLIIMPILMIKNWLMDIKYFVTFEEITKADLDNFFRQINNDKFTEKGLEWWTAQLGHFWIELRIKNSVKTKVNFEKKKENGFMHTNNFNSEK